MRTVSACKTCRAAIVWNTTPAGKLTPINVADGAPHWASCNAPTAHRKKPDPPPPDAPPLTRQARLL
jgi:hypothetical protein